MPGPAKPVFISYASVTGGAAARALEAALGAELVYRDETNLQHGAQFPEQLFEALIGARVIVCILDAAYWDSWFCRAEFDLALAEGAGEHLVIALDGADMASALRELPPMLRTVHWPLWGATAELAALIQDRLDDSHVSPLSDRLTAEEIADRRGWLNEEARLPPRRSFADGRLECNVPPMPTGRFAGRATELGKLHGKLLSPQGPGICAVVAPGGAGKTRLAQEYVWRHGAVHYPGGVVWLSAAATESRDQQLYEVLAQLIPDLPSLGALLQMNIDLGKRLREALAELSSEDPLLWVIDNLPEPAPGQPPIAIEEWAPVGNVPVAVLVTSRLRQQPVSVNLEVGALERSAAMLLLQRNLEPGLLSPEEAERIATAVGDWPLALELLNASFVAQALTAREFLALHDRVGAARVLDDTMEVLREQVPVGALRGVSESMLLTYEHLSPGAQLLARTLSHFAAASEIPLTLAEALPPGIWTPAARTALVSRTLLTGASRDAIGVIHPLVGDFLRAQDSDRAGLDAASTALLTFAEGHDPADPSTWLAINPMKAHAEIVWERGELPAEAGMRLGIWLATSMYQFGPYAGAVKHWEVLVAAAGRLWGLTHPETLKCARRYGMSLQLVGRSGEARAVLEETLAGSTEALGAEHLETLLTRGRYLDAVWATGDRTGEQSLAEALLAIEERVLGPEHPETLRTRRNLANAFWGKGALREARAGFAEVLAIQTRTLGPEHPDTLYTSVNLAGVLFESGDPAGGRTLLEAALAIQERLFGPEDRFTLRTRGDLATALGDLGDLTGARTLREAELASRTRLLGPEHPITLHDSLFLVPTLLKLGDFSRARTLSETVLATLERVRGPEHLLTLHARGNLAETLRKQGDVDAAWRLFERNQESLRRVFGPEHHWTLRFSLQRAATLRERGDGSSARVLFVELRDTCERVLGTRHPLTHLATHELALTLRELGDFTGARDQLATLLTARQEALPPHHFDTTHAAHDLYRLHRELGETEAAESLYESELHWLVELEEEPEAWAQREIKKRLMAERPGV